MEENITKLEKQLSLVQFTISLRQIRFFRWCFKIPKASISQDKTGVKWSTKAFQKVKSLLYIKFVGVSQKSHRVSSFPSFRPFVGNRANTSPIRRSGGKVLLSTIQYPFHPEKQTPWESQSTSGEGECVLRKL